MQVTVKLATFNPIEITLSQSECTDIWPIIDAASIGGGGWHNRYSHFPACMVNLPRALYESREGEGTVEFTIESAGDLVDVMERLLLLTQSGAEATPGGKVLMSLWENLQVVRGYTDKIEQLSQLYADFPADDILFTC